MIRATHVLSSSVLCAAFGCQLIAGIDEIKEYKPVVVPPNGGVGVAGESGSGGVVNSAGLGGAENGGSGPGGAGGKSGCEPDPKPTRCTDGVPEFCAEDRTWKVAAQCVGSTPRCKDGVCIPPPSCEDPSLKCGKDAENCCTTLRVDGGTFDRESPQGSPAKVSSFYLDKFEISVGRFAKFLENDHGTQKSPPDEGDGKNPHIESSGWSAAWKSALLTDRKSLAPALGTPGGLNCHEFATWGSADPSKPLNCLTWYEAFAFCIWDGGRLPTEAEWAYATAGGLEQRIYPWGDPGPGPNAEFANWNCYFDGSSGVCSASSIAPTGSASKGNGKFGHSDLSGNLSEWVLDWVSDSYPPSCTDCAQLTPAAERVVRGGDFRATNALEITSFRRASVKPSVRKETLGARCARDLEAAATH